MAKKSELLIWRYNGEMGGYSIFNDQAIPEPYKKLIKPVWFLRMERNAYNDRTVSEMVEYMNRKDEK